MVDHFEDISSELAKNPSQAVLVNSDHFDSSFTMLANKPLPYQIPMILCSVPTTTQVYETLGVSNVLIKPISQDMLLKTIGSLKLSGKTILIVDDEPDALRLFRRMLLAADPTYRVLRARDGQEALKMLQKEQPDVILLDLVMPNMDGFELLKLIKKDPVKSKIPVVLISARDPSGHPIISNAVALMHQGGLSIQHLLRFIQLSEAIFVPEAQAGDQKPAKVFPQ